MKRTDEILSDAMIYTRLAANTGIHLRQKRRWNLNHGDAAHVNRSDETRHISNHTPAKRNYRGLTGQLESDHAVQKAGHRGQSLGALAIWDERYRKFVLKSLSDRFKNAWLGDNQEGAAKSGSLDVFFKMVGEPRLSARCEAFWRASPGRTSTD